MELSSRSPLVGKTKLMDSQLEECLNFLGKEWLVKMNNTMLTPNIKECAGEEKQYPQGDTQSFVH